MIPTCSEWSLEWSLVSTPNPHLHCARFFAVGAGGWYQNALPQWSNTSTNITLPPLQRNGKDVPPKTSFFASRVNFHLSEEKYCTNIFNVYLQLYIYYININLYCIKITLNWLMSQNKFIKLSFLAINKKTYWKKQTNRVEDIGTHFLSTVAWVSWFRQGRIEHLEAVDDSRLWLLKSLWKGPRSETKAA